MLAGQNLEMLTFRYHKTLVFGNFFKKLIWCFYFWRVLLVITNPPLYDYSTLSPHIHLSLHSFQENWLDHKKLWRFHQMPSLPPPIVQGGWYHGSLHSSVWPSVYLFPLLSFICLFALLMIRYKGFSLLGVT